MSPIKHEAVYHCDLCRENYSSGMMLTFQTKVEGEDKLSWVLKPKQIVCGHNDTEDTIVICSLCAQTIGEARDAQIKAATSLDQ